MNYTQIVPFLAQGSQPPEGDYINRSGWNVLALCAEEYQPKGEKFPGVKVLHVPLDDSGFRITREESDIATRAAVRLAELIKNENNVLVTCHMGINRSGFVTALTLHHLTGKSGAECIKMVQRRRPMALQGPTFVAYLNAIPAKSVGVGKVSATTATNVLDAYVDAALRRR